VQLRSTRNTPEDLDIVKRPDMVGMHVWWTVSREEVGAEKILFDTAIFPPHVQHGLHRHPHAEEICYLVSGSGYHITETGLVYQAERDVAYIPANEWHGFYNPSDEPVVMVSAWGGVASIKDYGYEEMDGSKELVAAMIAELERS